MTTFSSLPRLGVGLNYQPGLNAAIESIGDLIDFFEISPDLLCRERVRDGERALDYHPPLLDEALHITADRPLVVHGLGLSIGSAAGWNEGYLRILDELYARRPFLWHSEHLAFLLTTDSSGRPLHMGVPLPLPFTEEALATARSTRGRTRLALRRSIPAGEFHLLSSGFTERWGAR